MKEIIIEEIVKQKNLTKRNKGYIQRLQRMLDSDEVSQKDFVGTGLLMTRADFLKDNTTEAIHTMCTDVMCYLGGVNIQFIKDGSYLFETTQSNNIKELEALAFDNLNKK